MTVSEREMKKNLPIVMLVNLLFVVSCQAEVSSLPEDLSIGTIQGCSHVSPYVGKMVTDVEGIVTHKFKNGFTMQSVVVDSSDCTSDAIFVYTEEYPDFLPGELVSVDGTVNEFIDGDESDHYLSTTEIQSAKITVKQEKVPIPEAIILGRDMDGIPLNWIKQTPEFDFHTNGLDYYESLEFMLVEVDSGVVVGAKNAFNEFFVLPEEYISKNTLSESGALLQTAEDENPEKIMVDAAPTFRQHINVGDTFTQPIKGILMYEYGEYRIWTITDPILQGIEFEENWIEPSEGSLSIATYNIENFSQYDDASKTSKIGCQIAQELNSPDVVVLQEVMDDSGVADDQVTTSTQTLQTLTDSIHACGGAEYSFSDAAPQNNHDGGIQGGNIRNVMLYRDDSGIVLTLPNDTVDGVKIENGHILTGDNPIVLFSDEAVFEGTRKPRLWLFTWEGEQYLLIGLHLVSQSAKTPDWGALQPPENPEQTKREQQMQLITEYTEQLLTEKEDLNLILVGDLNDYRWSDTLKYLESSGLQLVNGEKSNSSEDFSYIHNGNAFRFDYAAVSMNLIDRVGNFSILHLNTLYENQVSDHDPVIFEIYRGE